jgi:hypothetical protein
MKELMALPPITTINFAEKPLPLCGLSSVKKLSLAEINQRFSLYRAHQFIWNENIYIPDEWEINSIDKMKLDEIAEKFIPIDKLCACFMHKEVGYGVYTLQPIDKGSILLYSGIIKKFAREKLYYGMQAGENYVVDGQRMSGFADLFQDLYEPTLDTIESYQEIARNNFTAKSLVLSCGAITLLEANTDIPVLTQCGVSYGALFWKMQERLHQIKKKFFSLQGMIIAK